VTNNNLGKDPSSFGEWLHELSQTTQTWFLDEHQAREQALRTSREIVRNSANSIRATHRGEFQTATHLLDEITVLTKSINDILEYHPRVYYAGFVEDAMKEYAEAAATLSFVRGHTPPSLEELGIGAAPYLNGLAEAVGELRRYSLDSLRQDEFDRCERVLTVMDEVYSILVTMDFPEAVTGGLRRRTDAARGLLERTRGDITLALRQHKLEKKLRSFKNHYQITNRFFNLSGRLSKNIAAKNNE
jgi:translin